MGRMAQAAQSFPSQDPGRGKKSHEKRSLANGKTYLVLRQRERRDPPTFIGKKKVMTKKLSSEEGAGGG